MTFISSFILYWIVQSYFVPNINSPPHPPVRRRVCLVWRGRGGCKSPEVLIHGEAPQRAQGEQGLDTPSRTELSQGEEWVTQKSLGPEYTLIVTESTPNVLGTSWDTPKNSPRVRAHPPRWSPLLPSPQSAVWKAGSSQRSSCVLTLCPHSFPSPVTNVSHPSLAAPARLRCLSFPSTLNLPQLLSS